MVARPISLFVFVFCLLSCNIKAQTCFDVTTIFGTTFISSLEYAYSNNADKAFDKSASTSWSAGSAKYTNQWIGARFLHAQTIDSFTFQAKTTWDMGMKDYHLDVSNDGVTWTVVKSGTFAQSTSVQVITLTTPVAAQYVRIFAVNLYQTCSCGEGIGAAEITFTNCNGYTYTNPTCQDLTTRTDAVFTASHFVSGYEPYKAFDKVFTTRWGSRSYGYTNEWIAMSLNTPARVSHFTFEPYTTWDVGMKDFHFDYYTGSSWVTAVSGTFYPLTTVQKVELPTPVTATAFRLFGVNLYQTCSCGEGIGAAEIQIFDCQGSMCCPSAAQLCANLHSECSAISTQVDTVHIACLNDPSLCDIYTNGQNLLAVCNTMASNCDAEVSACPPS